MGEQVGQGPVEGGLMAIVGRDLAEAFPDQGGILPVMLGDDECLAPGDVLRAGEESDLEPLPHESFGGR